MPDPRTPEQAHLDDLLDDALDDSFPASDPPSLAQPHDRDGADDA